VLTKIDAVVLPSRWYESFGITIREAVRAKRPVIVSDIGSFTEAIKHQENGLVCQAGDAVSLREAMEQLVQNPELAERLVEKSMEVETLENHRAKLLELYREAVSARKADASR